MKFTTPHIKSLLLLLVGWVVLCSFNTTLESIFAANYWGNRDTLPCFLVISDIHLLTSADSTQHELDSGTNTGDSLWDATKNKIRELYIVNHPKFIIVLGASFLNSAALQLAG